MSTTEILLFAILIAIIMCVISIILFGVTTQYWQYRSRWEKIKKTQVEDAKKLEKKVLAHGKNGLKGVLNGFITIFVLSTILSLAIYYAIKLLTS